MRDTRCSHSASAASSPSAIPARPAWRPGPGWPDGARPGQRRFHRTGGSAADAAARRRRLRRLRSGRGRPGRDGRAASATRPRPPDRSIAGSRPARAAPGRCEWRHRAGVGATAAMREPARLADRRGRTSDGNPGLGVHRGARRPDGHHALHGNRGRRGRRRNGALAILAARPVLIGALAVAFIAPTGMALLATPVETAIAAVVPGVFRASLRTAVAAVVVVFTTAILLAIVTARLPAAVLASAAGIFPARILTIIAGVFPASFLAARGASRRSASPCRSLRP